MDRYYLDILEGEKSEIKLKEKYGMMYDNIQQLDAETFDNLEVAEKKAIIHKAIKK